MARARSDSAQPEAAAAAASCVALKLHIEALQLTVFAERGGLEQQREQNLGIGGWRSNYRIRSVITFK